MSASDTHFNNLDNPEKEQIERITQSAENGDEDAIRNCKKNNIEF